MPVRVQSKLSIQWIKAQNSGSAGIGCDSSPGFDSECVALCLARTAAVCRSTRSSKTCDVMSQRRSGPRVGGDVVKKRCATKPFGGCLRNHWSECVRISKTEKVDSSQKGARAVVLRYGEVRYQVKGPKLSRRGDRILVCRCVAYTAA